jgi:hypothetical protein
VVTDAGIAYCLEGATGKELWKERLAGSFSASPLLAGGHVYATSETGTTFVFRAADSFELMARNEIEGECLASPVTCDGRLFLRTAGSLYCIGHGE